MNTACFQRIITAALLVLSTCTAPALAAGTTVYNRTEHDLWVASGNAHLTASVLATDGSSSFQNPHSVRVNAWFKLPRFGGSVDVPYATHLLIMGPQGYQKHFLDGSRAFPLRANGVKSDFFRKFDTVEDPWKTGELRKAATQGGYQFQMFSPVSYFTDRQTGKVEITLEKLGWQATGGNGGANPTPTNRRLQWTSGTGSIRDDGNGRWVEFQNGVLKFRFEETERNDDFIELYDASRGYYVRLYQDAMLIKGGKQGVTTTFASFTKLVNGSWTR